MGHDVTVFGAEGSEGDVTMLADAAWSHDLGGVAEAARQATYLARVYAAMAGRRFDVIHDHTGFEGLLLAIQSGLASVVVHTIHGELTEPMRTFYKEVAERARLCAISLSQAASAPDIKLAGIVHNAVELPTAPPGVAHERYLIEVARITPDKGQHLAIQVAQRAGRKLILAGKVERSGEGLQYFEEQVEPYLSPTVEYYPNVAGAQKARLISRAAAGELRRRLSDPVDDRLPLARGLIQPAGLRVVVDHQRPVVDADQPRAVKGVAADHPLARFLRPHLVEDEVAVRVGNEVAVVDLDRLHPVRMVADDEVRPIVNREVADLFRVVGGDAGSGNREQFVLLAPVEADDDNVGLGTDQVDLALQLGPVDPHADPIETEERELDAPDVSNLVEAQSRHPDPVFREQDLCLVGPRRAEIRE